MESNEQLIERLHPNVPVLSAAQTAAVLGWDRKKIYNMADSLPFVKRVGGEVVISKRSLIEWLDELDAPKSKPQSSPPKTSPPVPVAAATDAPPKKRVGRRRNSEKRANDPLSVWFVKQVLAEMQSKALEEAIAACKSIQLKEDDEQGRAVLDALIALPGMLLAEREAMELAVALQEGISRDD